MMPRDHTQSGCLDFVEQFADIGQISFAIGFGQRGWTVVQDIVLGQLGEVTEA